MRIIELLYEMYHWGLDYQHSMTIVSDDHRWCLYYKCVIALALPLAIALASVINCDHEWRHNLERHTLTTPKASFMIVPCSYTGWQVDQMTQRQQNCPSREVLLKGRLSTVDLLVLTTLDQLLFILKKLFKFFTKQAILMRRSTVLSLPPSVSIPWSIRPLSLTGTEKLGEERVICLSSNSQQTGN